MALNVDVLSAKRTINEAGLHGSTIAPKKKPNIKELFKGFPCVEVLTCGKNLEKSKLKINNKRIRSLTREEEVDLLSELEPKNPKYYSKLTPSTERLQLLNQRIDNYDLVLLLMDLGARYSEVAQLKWEQIDLTLQTINLIRTKTNNETVLMMSNRVFEVLKRRSDNNC